MPSRQPDKPKLTPELKQELIKRVAELKIEGKSYNVISNELGICFNSAMKYWQIHLKENSKIDLDELLIDRQQTTERLVQKPLEIIIQVRGVWRMSRFLMT
jgi:transposase-like protein